MEIANSGNQKYFSKGIQALEILASVVSALEEKNPFSKSASVGLERTPNAATTTKTTVPSTTMAVPDHRVSCHRCGNIRKKKVVCVKISCPHIFCGRCSDKMKEEYGREIFVGGCPVCKDLCCCTNKSVYCNRINHCYRKCPATKTARTPSNKRERESSSVQSPADGDDGQEVDEHNTGVILGRKRTAMNNSPAGYADDLLNSIYVSPSPETSALASFRSGVADVSQLKMPPLLPGVEPIGPSLIGNQAQSVPFAVLPQSCVFLWADGRTNTVPVMATADESIPKEE
jgi:hypothetical protein